MREIYQGRLTLEQCKEVHSLMVSGVQLWVGQKINKVTILKIFKLSKGHTVEIKCDCGKIVRLASYKVINRHSCGSRACRPGTNTKHGLIRFYPEEYKTWIRMKIRCLNKNCKEFYRYGGRGIEICPEWKSSFKNFLSHIGPKPTKNYSLDRIDNNGNYEPGNCRWATPKIQANNTRKNIVVEIDGKKQKLNELCEGLGIKTVKVIQRIQRGWPVKKAIITPFIRSKKSRAWKETVGP